MAVVPAVADEVLCASRRLEQDLVVLREIADQLQTMFH